MIPINGKYTNAIIYTDNIEQEAISQLYGLCNHPAFEGATIRVMPDVHAGAGCTIGTTVKLAKRMVIPNIVGVDIGCGVLTTIFKATTPIDFKKLDDFIIENIPSGMSVRNGKHSKLNDNVKKEIKEIVENLNLGNLNYFINSVGTLGGGNHYIEIGKIDDTTFALSVHTGSRNLGKKVCDHFQLRAQNNMKGGPALKDAIDKKIVELKKEHREKDINKEIMNLKNNFEGKILGIPRGLEYIEDKDFDDYMCNMLKCQSMAAENRRLIATDIIKFLNVDVIEQFDTIHNYIEVTHECDEFACRPVYYIRKGAISAKMGEKLAIPLNMRDGVIIGIGKGNEDWNCSAPHGAGRLLSRSKAKEQVSLEEFEDAMSGIQTWSVCKDTIDESPQAYKPAEEIVELVKDTIEIQYIVKPIYNYKAHTVEKTWKERKLEAKEKKE